jgi:N-acetyltransferase
MQYIPSNADDAALHKKFHAMNLGGVDFTKPVIERFRKNQVWSGGDGAFIAAVGRKDAVALRNRASDVLKVVNTELAAVPISDDELWSQTDGAGALDEDEKASKPHAPTSGNTKQPLVDRFKVYLYFRGNKCVGACLAERIWEAFAVLGKTDTTTQTSETCESSVAPQSSSISISSASDPAILGVSRIWTSNQSRKQGIASRLLETVRCDFQYGLVIEKGKMAFSQPTESGGNLARKWFGSQAGWHVYID